MTDFPESGLIAAGFASRMLKDYVDSGGSAGDLFVAFVGLVSARDEEFGGECLLALEEAVISKKIRVGKK